MQHTPFISFPPDTPSIERIRVCLPELTRHGFKVLVLCLLIASALWWNRSDMGFDVQLVYSLATGIFTWLIIDLGRFFIDRASPFQFPRSWKGPALIVAGCLVGHIIGTLLGDAYCGGQSSLIFLQNNPWRSLNFLLLSVATGGAISYFFYTHGKAHYLRSELEASQRQATQAQLALLQSQLEPHMLFNTLANLRALIGTDPERATAMLDRLNDYLRATLGASRASVQPLSAEFARLSDYLELMAVRMGTRLTYALDLPPALANVPIPSLLLQPLVENSIKHGLEPTVKGGRIEVRAQLASDGRVEILVSDNGVGFDESTSPPEGFGLAHIRERLHSAYGTQGNMEIVANNDDMTMTLVKFPVNMGVKYV
jgi:signal transduction histidine kinase